jgi:hypothetical protein
MSDLNGGTWTCPKCGYEVDFTGPATKKLLIDDHNYWKHELVERRENEYIAEGGVPPIDELFYLGSWLSHTDLRFLQAIHVLWNQVDNPRLTA